MARHCPERRGGGAPSSKTAATQCSLWLLYDDDEVRVLCVLGSKNCEEEGVREMVEQSSVVSNQQQNNGPSFVVGAAWFVGRVAHAKLHSCQPQN
mmetsp:Transcript_18409/g.57134  ORF Transcript_18409/g.57134 Transcript_18409/m.57134 type:complete len:95 (-) Transcript_18409:18-302(-)